MPDYVTDALKRFKRLRPRRIQNAPNASAAIIYGAKQQFANEEIEEDELDGAPLVRPQPGVKLALLIALGVEARF